MVPGLLVVVFVAIDQAEILVRLHVARVQLEHAQVKQRGLSAFSHLGECHRDVEEGVDVVGVQANHGFPFLNRLRHIAHLHVDQPEIEVTELMLRTGANGAAIGFDGPRQIVHAMQKDPFGGNDLGIVGGFVDGFVDVLDRLAVIPFFKEIDGGFKVSFCVCLIACHSIFTPRSVRIIANGTDEFKFSREWSKIPRMVATQFPPSGNSGRHRVPAEHRHESLRDLVVLLVFLGCTFVEAGESVWFRWAGSWGAPGHESTQLLEPKAMRFSPDGLHLAVSDTANNRVMILRLNQAGGAASFTCEAILGDIWPFEGSQTPHDWPDRYHEADNSDGLTPRRELKGRLYQGGQARVRRWDRVPMDRFYLPQGLVWKDPRTLIVCDTGNHRLKVVTIAGEVLTIIGQEGWKDGYFHHPTGIDLDDDGTLYVTEPRSQYIRGLGLDFAQRQRTQGNRVQVFNKEYKFQSRWGHMHHMSGRRWRQFKDPTRIHLARNGRIYVTDSGNHRILISGKDGRPEQVLQKWPYYRLRYPQGVDSDSSGLIAVADTGNHRVLILEGDQLLQVIGGFGVEMGRFVEPREARFGPDGNLYVLDSNNCRIQIYERVGGKPPPPPKPPAAEPPASEPLQLPPGPPESEPADNE